MVLPDPRLRVAAADLKAQFGFLVAVRDRLDHLNRTLNDMDADRGRLRTLGADPSASALAAALEAIRGRLIDVHMQGAQLWPSGLHEKMNALFRSADSADAAPTAQEREVFEMLSAQLAREVERYEGLRGVPLLGLDALARAALGTAGEDGAPGA